MSDLDNKTLLTPVPPAGPGDIVPRRPKGERVTIYADESYIPGDPQLSGASRAVLQVALPLMPKSEARLAAGLDDLVRGKRRSGNLRELKGASICKGNLKIFEEAVDAIGDAINDVGQSTPLRALVVIDGRDPKTSVQAAALTTAMQRLGWSDQTPLAERLVADFARQLRWLLRASHFVSVETLSNPVTAVFDESHGNAEATKKVVGINSEHGLGRGVGLLMSHAEIVGMMAPILIEMLLGERAKLLVDEVEFRKSHESLVLQAADIVANVTFGGIRYELGERTEATELRLQLLRRLVPNFALEGWIHRLLSVRGGAVYSRGVEETAALRLFPAGISTPIGDANSEAEVADQVPTGGVSHQLSSEEQPRSPEVR